MIARVLGGCFSLAVSGISPFHAMPFHVAYAPLLSPQTDYTETHTFCLSPSIPHCTRMAQSREVLRLERDMKVVQRKASLKRAEMTMAAAAAFDKRGDNVRYAAPRRCFYFVLTPPRDSLCRAERCSR